MDSPITDARATELYAQFRARLRDTTSLEAVPYPTLLGERIHPITIPYAWAAPGIVCELANGINELGLYLQRLDAWHSTAAALSEDEKSHVMLEHLRPLFAWCANAPYALRGRIIHGVCAVSVHANSILDGPALPPAWNGKQVNMTIAKGLAKRWGAWPDLAKALMAMDGEAFTTSTGDFRSHHHHGHPPSLIGHVATIQPKAPNGWTLGEVAPLSIEKLLPTLVDEHRRALVAFRAFVALVEEQITSLPEATDEASVGFKILTE